MPVRPDAVKKACASASIIVKALLVALAIPAGFVAVTTQVTDKVASAWTSVYVDEVAPDIGFAPLYHWYVYVGIGVPMHVPVVLDSICPTTAVPEMTGATVFDGGIPPPPPPAFLVFDIIVFVIDIGIKVIKFLLENYKLCKIHIYDMCKMMYLYKIINYI